MHIDTLSVNQPAKPSERRRRWPSTVAVAFAAVLTATLLGGTLGLSGHHVDGANQSSGPERQTGPAMVAPLAGPDPYSFVGTVPDSPVDEVAISPMETVGAADH